MALATLGVLAGALLLSPAPALATPPHEFSGSLPVPTEGFNLPWGLGVGPEGEVFVNNLGSSRMDVYSSSNAFETEFEFEAPHESYQMAVDDSSEAGDPSKGDLYIATLGTGSVLKYEYNRSTKTATKLASISGLVEPSAVAVNAKGDVYVADFVHGEEGKGYVNKYGPEGTLITKELITGLTTPEALAVNSSGDIFVGSVNGVLEYEEDGTCMNSCAAFAGVTTLTNGLAVGPNGDVYVGEANADQISVFKEDGTSVETFPIGIAFPFGIGVSGNGRTVYVTSEQANEVDEFTLPQPLSAKTEVATEVTKTAAKLHAKVALEGGGKIRYHFDYGKATEPEVETPDTEVTVTSGSPEAEVTAEITGLEPGETYHYKIVATDTAAESIEGANEELTTEIVVVQPSELVTGEAEEIMATSVQLGSVGHPSKLNPGGESKYYLEYGTAPCVATPVPNCGTSTVPEMTATGNSQRSVAPIKVSGLKPYTTYHYWLVAKNGEGSAEGEEREFTTLPEAPSQVKTEAAEAITTTTAKLDGLLNPGGGATYYFEYGTEACGVSTCGTQTPESALLVGDTPLTAAPAEVAALKPDTIYHYWLVARNSAGTVHGGARQFKTAESSVEVQQEEEQLKTELERAKLLESEATASSAANEKHEQEVAASAAAAKKRYEEVEAVTEANKLREVQAEEAAGTSVTITATKVAGDDVRVTIRASRAGTVTIAGSGLKVTIVKVGAGSHTVKVPLTRAGRTARRHGRKTKVTVTLVTAVRTVSASKTFTL
ncbi:MAG: hypothetical protein ACLP1Q_21675 [Solirubrobacteraceae bacterium]